MPRPPHTDEEIERMRNRILDATHELLHEEGPGTLTIRRIAGRLGLSHMTLYHYFPSRDAILQALSERQFVRLAARHKEQVERAQAGLVVEVLKEELTRFAGMVRERPEMFRLAVHYMLSEEAGYEWPAFHERVERHSTHLAHLAQIGVQQGVFTCRDPRMASRVIHAAMHGAIISQVSRWLDEDVSFDILWREVTDMILTYLTADLRSEPDEDTDRTAQ